MNWRVLIVTLPGNSATARMRVWRAVKSLGCAALRDGVYLLPSSDSNTDALLALADDAVRDGGSAWVGEFTPLGSAEVGGLEALFDRTEDYRAQIRTWNDLIARLPEFQPAELLRAQRKYEREYEALRAIDFFPGDISAEAEIGWQEFRARLQRALSPDEPRDSQGDIPRLQAADYQGRTWATRRRLWVDRVASAWLIRRFIDPQARFLWLAQPSDCPHDALGFDFDGAAFTHVGDRVTFETLLASFGLEGDASLMRLGALVHSLDVGGEAVPEAKGFEAMLAGARERHPDDDALLSDIGSVLDSLHAHFTRETSRPKP